MDIKKIIFLLLCLGFISLNALSQSKLQGAGKATKVGATTSTQKKQTGSAKPSEAKKPASSSTQTKRSSGGDEKYASKGYMEILGLSFSNEDADDNIIDNYESKLYAKEVRYLTPRLSYKGLASVEKEIKLDVKLYDEDGKLKTGTGSPEGFTFSKTVKVETGTGKYIKLPGWGNPRGGSYNAGLYKIEVWYKENMLYSKEIRLYSGTAPIVNSDILSISSISFANTDKDGKIISDFGQTLYDGKVQYLKPRIYYNGKYSTNQEVVLYVRYFKSSGGLVSGSSSPVGFSYKESVTIKPGSNSVTLSGFGNEAATNYKEGSCRVEIWIDGEKLFETDVKIVKQGYTSNNGSESSFLKSILEKPMGKGNCNPITASYYTVKNSLNDIYKVVDNSGANDNSFRIRASENSSLSGMVYHGIPFEYFLYLISTDNSSVQRRMKYEFEIAKNQIGSLENAYARLDLIVKDFNSLGYAIKYQRKDDKYTKAKGDIRVGNIEYEIQLDEYTSTYQFIINVWVFKN